MRGLRCPLATNLAEVPNANGLGSEEFAVLRFLTGHRPRAEAREVLAGRGFAEL